MLKKIRYIFLAPFKKTISRVDCLIILCVLILVTACQANIDCRSFEIKKRIELILTKSIYAPWRQPDEKEFLLLNVIDTKKEFADKFDQNIMACPAHINYRINSKFLSDYIFIFNKLKKFGINFQDLENKEFFLAQPDGKLLNLFYISFDKSQGGYFIDLKKFDFKIDPLVLNYSELEFRKLRKIISAILDNLNSKDELNLSHASNVLFKTCSHLQDIDNYYCGDDLTVSIKKKGSNFVEFKIINPNIGKYKRMSLKKTSKLNSIPDNSIILSFKLAH